MKKLPLKTCTKCKIEKPINRFRFRTKRGYTWQMGKCIDCEHDENKKRYYDNHEKSKERGKENQKKLRERHPDMCKKQYQKRKDDPKYKEYRKKYWRENEEQRNKHRVIATKHHEKRRDNLTDKYIIQQLKQKTGLSSEDVLKAPDLIELKRLSIKLKRQINEERKGIK